MFRDTVLKLSVLRVGGVVLNTIRRLQKPFCVLFVLVFSLLYLSANQKAFAINTSVCETCETALEGEVTSESKWGGEALFAYFNEIASENEQESLLAEESPGCAKYREIRDTVIGGLIIIFTGAFLYKDYQKNKKKEEKGDLLEK